jgi:surface antigen
MARGAALLILIGMAGATLAACSATGGGPAVGTGTTAVTAAVPGGIALDARAQRAAREAENRALEFGRTGVPVPWHKGSVYGEVVPGAKYQVNTFNCRDFTHMVASGGQKQTTRGTACRQPDGTWQVVE